MSGPGQDPICGRKTLPVAAIDTVRQTRASCVSVAAASFFFSSASASSTELCAGHLVQLALGRRRFGRPPPSSSSRLASASTASIFPAIRSKSSNADVLPDSGRALLVGAGLGAQRPLAQLDVLEPRVQRLQRRRQLVAVDPLLLQRLLRLRALGLLLGLAPQRLLGERVVARPAPPSRRASPSRPPRASRSVDPLLQALLRRPCTAATSVRAWRADSSMSRTI